MCEDSNRNIIANNTISQSNLHGISLSRYSINNSITDNTISHNLYGVELYRSYHNIMMDNIITHNYYGIKHTSGSSGNIISKNFIANNRDGIQLSHPTSRNNISSNVFSNNTHGGITITHDSTHRIFSSDNIILDNSFYNDGLLLRDTRVTTVSNNIVNGKSLVYLDGISHKTIDHAGQVILIECNNITVQNQGLNNTVIGVQLLQTNCCHISENNISSNNIDGIWFWKSNDNKIIHNIITNNHYNGINLEYSDRNTISRNNIKNNEYGIRFYDDIEWGWEFPETSKSNRITRNNIYHNTQEEAFFHNSLFNQWNNNYWGKHRLFYPVKGEIYLERGWHMGSPPSIDLSIFRFDWYPANAPYDIE
jgi:parallel beta-helix repeat protein